MVADAKTRYRIESLDVAALRAALMRYRQPIEEAEGGLVVRVADEQQAATLLAALVRDGVPVHRFGPAGSALEQTYMLMNEERR